MSDNEKDMNMVKAGMGFTITICNCAENGPGMEHIKGSARQDVDYAKIASVQTLLDIKRCLDASGYDCRYVPLDLEHGGKKYEAGVLTIDNFLGKEYISALREELMSLEWDKKAWMRGRVVNKKARHNLCFAGRSQEPDYENKKGRIVSWEDAPMVKGLVDDAENIIGESLNLVAEGNYYYSDECYIGYHGDAEREFVFAVRIGKSNPIRYKWFYDSKAISEETVIPIPEGGAYIMSSKAVGTDWKKKKIPTLRHAVFGDKCKIP